LHPPRLSFCISPSFARLTMVFSAGLLVALQLAAYCSAASIVARAPPPVVMKCEASNKVALTFDDGPYIYMRDITDTLTNAGAKGTFFVNGNNYGCIYSSSSKADVKYAYDHGMQIGSHTWAHADLATLSSSQIDSEMSKTELAIQRITGSVPAFTRPPYGSYNDLVQTVAANRGQTLVTWDFDSRDSLGDTPTQQKSAYDALILQHPGNLLSLQHETSESTAHDVLPYVIQKFQQAGYQLVTLAECLGQAPYQSTQAPTTGNWSC
jgi:peptidoglycan/xylan/chitin deacetylase (PgdA/CDA1 family)